MKTFNSTQKGYNRQYATAYIMYMMAGSYFFSCKTSYRLRNLHLHYAEMPRQKQYDHESHAISSMEELDKDFLQRISTLRCEVICRACGEELFMDFNTGGFEGIHCRIYKNGSFQLTPCGE